MSAGLCPTERTRVKNNVGGRGDGLVGQVSARQAWRQVQSPVWILKKNKKKLGIGPCTCNPNAMDMETGKSSLLVT